MRIAIYAGTFDPITRGHQDIIGTLINSRLFDRIVISIAKNPNKKSMFTENERQKLIKEIYQNSQEIVVDILEDGKTVVEEYVNKYLKEGHSGCLIRGIRNTLDMEYEFALCDVNNKIAGGFYLPTFFVKTNPKVSGLSSTIIKEIFNLRPRNYEEILREMIHPIILEAMINKQYDNME